MYFILLPHILAFFVMISLIQTVGHKIAALTVVFCDFKMSVFNKQDQNGKTAVHFFV